MPSVPNPDLQRQSFLGEGEMDEHVTDLPEEFVELVRDALLHLYEPSHLQTHPLLAAMGETGSSSATRGKRLYQALLSGIEALRPLPGTDAQSRAWRAYRILELRYIDGSEAASVMSRVALSKNQYHRDHGRALLAVASLLWERWQLDGRWPDSTDLRRAGEARPQDLARTEVENLLGGAGSGQTDWIDPAEVLASVETLLKPLCAQRDVTLRVDVTIPLPSLLGSRVALRQALLTILAQLIGAAAPGQVSISVDSEGRRIAFRVSAVLDGAHQPGQLTLAQSLPFVEALHGTLMAATPPEDPKALTVAVTFPVSEHASLLVVDNSPDCKRSGVVRVVRRLAPRRPAPARYHR